MEKEEYLYMILKNIEDAKRLKEENVNKKEFYQKIESKENLKDFDNNIEYANKTIDSLENLIYLPVYEIIKKMSNNDLLKYKKNILSKIDENIFKSRNQIEKLNSEIKELSDTINQIVFNYLRYKKEKVLNDEQLYSYITEYKEIKLQQDDINKEMKEHENNINEMMTRRNIIDAKTIEEIRDYLINTYDLNKITYELENYKVTRSDEIIVNLCKDLNALDEVESLIKEYITLRDKSMQKIIEIPIIFKDYKIKGITDIVDFILNKVKNINFHERTNETVIFDEKEIDLIKDNIDKVIKEIKDNKQRLIQFKLEINELAGLPFCYINKELVDFITNLCNTLYLTELEKNNVTNLYGKYTKLVNKKSKTNYSVDKSIRIQKELMYEIREILDIYWEVLCEELESLINTTNNDTEFIDDVYLYDINIGKNKMIFDTKNFSEIGLLNMRLVIEKILNKYTELYNNLNSFSDGLSYLKDNMINSKKNKEKELNNIKKRIDELYYKVSPNDFPILIEDYENLNKVFNEKTLIDSIVKINRKNLISKVRSESVNYRDKENLLKEDIEVIKKKVLNK